MLFAGLPYGSSGRPPVTWNLFGGGYNRSFSNSSEGLHFQQLPLFAYLEPSDMDTVFTVCARSVAVYAGVFEVFPSLLNFCCFAVLQLDRGQCEFRQSQCRVVRRGGQQLHVGCCRRDHLSATKFEIFKCYLRQYPDKFLRW